IPVISGKGFDPGSAWTAAWQEPSLQQGVVPFVTPAAAGAEGDLLARADIAQLGWDELTPLARRFNAGAVIIATASEDGKTVQMVELSPVGRIAASFAYAQSSFAADADAVAERAQEAWKTRNAVDFATKARVVADVEFGSLEDWAKIRN